MKLIILLVAVSTASTTAFAAPVLGIALNNKCYRNAARAVSRFVEPNYYDKDGIETMKCAVSPCGSAVVCDVMASKGDGAATDTFMVVLDSSCTKSFRVELTGEE